MVYGQGFMYREMSCVEGEELDIVVNKDWELITINICISVSVTVTLKILGKRGYSFVMVVWSIDGWD